MAAVAKKRGGAPKVRRVCNVVPSRGTNREGPFGVAPRSTAVTKFKSRPESIDLHAAGRTIGDPEDTGLDVGRASIDDWGTNWGDRGFDYANEACIRAAFFDANCGVTA